MSVAKPTVVIVHGAWGGGWAWKGVGERLEAEGYEVYRATLTGLGERCHLISEDVDLSTHIQDVVNLVEFEQIDDFILIGHSYGGMVISGVVDRIPERIRQVVYIDAFVPEDGESVLTIHGRDGSYGWVESMIQGYEVVPPWVGPDAAYPHDVPHPLKTMEEAIVLKNPKAAEVTAGYILTIDPGLETDGFSADAERARERGWPVVVMRDTDHNVQWSRPDELVEILLELFGLSDQS